MFTAVISPVFRHRHSTGAGARRVASWGLKPSGQWSKPGSLNPGEAVVTRGVVLVQVIDRIAREQVILVGEGDGEFLERWLDRVQTECVEENVPRLKRGLRRSRGAAPEIGRAARRKRGEISGV